MQNGHVRWRGLVAAAVVITVMVIPVFGQQAGQNQDVLKALLVEVQGLRVAIEQMSSTGARVQLAMGRLQLQEQRINTMVRRLDEVRGQKALAEREVTDLRQQGARLDEAAKNEEDPLVRRAAADQSRETRRLADLRAADLQRLAGEEVEVSMAIATEQSRWSDINRALEDLERAMTSSSPGGVTF